MSLIETIIVVAVVIIMFVLTVFLSAASEDIKKAMRRTYVMTDEEAAEADAEAIASDWKAVGDDMKRAAKKVAKQQSTRRWRKRVDNRR
jgi:hypothetical protein